MLCPVRQLPELAPVPAASETSEAADASADAVVEAAAESSDPAIVLFTSPSDAELEESAELCAARSLEDLLNAVLISLATR